MPQNVNLSPYTPDGLELRNLVSWLVKLDLGFPALHQTDINAK